MSDASQMLAAGIVFGSAETSAATMGLMFQMAVVEAVLAVKREHLQFEADSARFAAEALRQQWAYDFQVGQAARQEAERGEG
jgi:hypothetical protein